MALALSLATCFDRNCGELEKVGMTNDDIERSLLDCDGSCRDINFSEHISTAGAVALVESIGAHWALSRATDVEGDAVQGADLTTFLASDEGALLTVWEGAGIPWHLQAYFYWTRPDRVFCELTFFPQDLAVEGFELKNFLELLAVFVSAARSREFYVRYEDASWRHAKGSAHHSVILSHEMLCFLARPAQGEPGSGSVLRS